MNEWDIRNVIMTGNSDGVVRVSKDLVVLIQFLNMQCSYRRRSHCQNLSFNLFKLDDIYLRQ